MPARNNRSYTILPWLRGITRGAVTLKSGSSKPQMRATQSSHKTIQDVVSAKKERIVGTKSLFRTGVDVKEDRGASKQARHWLHLDALTQNPQVIKMKVISNQINSKRRRQCSEQNQWPPTECWITGTKNWKNMPGGSTPDDHCVWN
jgi:hypothetical protein